MKKILLCTLLVLICSFSVAKVACAEGPHPYADTSKSLRAATGD